MARHSDNWLRDYVRLRMVAGLTKLEGPSGYIGDCRCSIDNGCFQHRLGSTWATCWPWDIEISACPMEERSNYRGRMTVMMAIQSFAVQLKGRTVQLLSDNITTIAYLNNLEGPQKNLPHLFTSIWAECHRFGISLQARHLMATGNILADQLARISLKW